MWIYSGKGVILGEGISFREDIEEFVEKDSALSPEKYFWQLRR